jgi:hypothetical protein
MTTPAITPPRLSPAHIGQAGESYVSMKLALAGLDAAIPPSGNPITDVFAHLDGATCSIQVKTRRHARAPMIDMRRDRIILPDFVAIVMLGEPLRPSHPAADPTAYVVPRSAMRTLWDQYGYEHPKRSNFRLDHEALARYSEAWHLIWRHLERSARHRHDGA